MCTLDPFTPRVSVRVWTSLAMTALRVCCWAILLVFIATTVSDHDLRGGFIKIVRHASLGLRVSARAHASLSMFSQTTSGTTSSFCRAQEETGSLARVILGSVIPTTRRLFTFGWTTVFRAHVARALGTSTVGNAVIAAPTIVALFIKPLLEIPLMPAPFLVISFNIVKEAPPFQRLLPIGGEMNPDSHRSRECDWSGPPFPS